MGRKSMRPTLLLLALLLPCVSCTPQPVDEDAQSLPPVTPLRPLLENPARPWKSAAFSETKREGYHGRTLRTMRYRYTEWEPLTETDGETQRELYDLDEDPNEHENLATEPAYRAIVDELSDRLRVGWQGALPERI